MRLEVRKVFSAQVLFHKLSYRRLYLVIASYFQLLATYQINLRSLSFLCKLEK